MENIHGLPLDWTSDDRLFTHIGHILTPFMCLNNNIKEDLPIFEADTSRIKCMSVRNEVVYRLHKQTDNLPHSTGAVPGSQLLANQKTPKWQRAKNP